MSFLRIPQALGLGLLVLASLAAPGAAQSFDFTVQPEAGTIGTVITLTANKGVDFGTKPPRVWLARSDSKKKLPLKVLSADATTITAEVKRVDKKAPDTEYTVVVQPKGKGVEALETDNGFTTRLIELVSATPLDVDATLGGEVAARFMENKPARVKLGGKPAKVTDWSPEGNADGGTPVGSFTVTPNKTLPNGTYDIELKTRSGIVTLPGAATITGSTAGKPKKKTFSAKIGKINFKPNAKVLKAPSFGAVAAPLWTQITVIANKGAKITYVMTLTLDWKPGDGDVVLTEEDLLFDQGVPFQINTISGPIFNPVSNSDLYDLTDFTMTICEGGGGFFGSFSGTLVKDAEVSTGNNPDTLAITKGQFNLPVFDGGGGGL